MTILEVMISVGVAAVGLFGVLALLPLASQMALHGLNEDQKAAAGKRAIESFEIRGMRRADTWLRWAANFPTPQFVPAVWNPGLDGGWGNAGIDDDGDGVSDDPANLLVELDESGWPGSDDLLTNRPVVPLAFCIDPRFIAHNAGAIVAEGLVRPFPLALPTPPTPAIAMPRITLRGATPIVPMSVPQADEIFQTKDDLVFVSSGGDAPPTEPFQFLPGPDGDWGVSGVDDDGDGTTDNASEAGFPGSDDVPRKRPSEGRMSWFATVVPKLNDAPGMYILSVVVLYQRDLQFDPAEVPALERVSTVTAFYAGGVNGGEVQLSVRVDTTPPAPPPTYTSHPDDLDLHKNDWVMLARNVVIDPGPPPVIVPTFRWYRVIAVDREMDVAADATDPDILIYSRNVTLQGPDWNLDDPSALPNFPTQATYVPGVVAVYERTVRLESSSLWSN